MLLTNKYNLPGPLYEAIKNDPYNAGDCDISTTRLISPPQIVALAKRHADGIEEDAVERLWAVLGQAFHTIIERAGDKRRSEKRYFASVDGWKISGAIDFLDEETLIDWKMTSVYTIIFDSRRKEWTEQGNVNRWLAMKNGYGEIKKLVNYALLRDWQKKKARTERDYPPIQMVTVPLDVWPMDKTEEFVRHRVAVHQAAQKLSDNELPNCTSAEIWLNRGKRTRCLEYCNVAKFCHQHQSALKENQNATR